MKGSHLKRKALFLSRSYLKARVAEGMNRRAENHPVVMVKGLNHLFPRVQALGMVERMAREETRILRRKVVRTNHLQYFSCIITFPMPSYLGPKLATLPLTRTTWSICSPMLSIPFHGTLTIALGPSIVRMPCLA